MCKVAPSWRVARARVRSSTHRGVSSCSQPLMAQRAGEVPRPRSNAYLDRLVLDSIEGTWWLIGGVRSAAAGGPRDPPRSCPCRDPRSWFLPLGRFDASTGQPMRQRRDCSARVHRSYRTY